MSRKSLIDAIADNTINVDEEAQRLLQKIGTIEQRKHPFPKQIEPQFRDATERFNWYREEQRRIRHGYDGISGLGYFYFNYWNMFRVEGGYGLPDFRMTNEMFCRVVEACLFGKSEFMESQQGKGIILLGRRRWGKTALMLASAYYTAMHFRGSQIGMTSKTETDIHAMLSIHLKEPLYRLPRELRMQSQANDNKREIFFGKRYKDSDGLNKVIGNGSKIYARSPDPKSFEGYGQRMFIVDEAGRIPDLMSIWSKVNPALNGNDGKTRVGVPIIGGTAGLEEEFGTEYQEFWYTAEDRGLLRYFVAGYTGFIVDEFGNDDVLSALKYILENRQKAKRLSEREYYEAIIFDPINPEEAFMSGGQSPFDLILLNAKEAQILNAEMIGDNPIGRG